MSGGHWRRDQLAGIAGTHGWSQLPPGDAQTLVRFLDAGWRPVVGDDIRLQTHTGTIPGTIVDGRPASCCERLIH
jgi:hypothetical protein